MIYKIRSLLFFLFKKIIPVSFIEKEIYKNRSDYFLKFCRMEKNVKFYPESRIHNLQENPDSILIGENTHIRGELQVFGYGGKIEIGNNCYIGDHSRIWSGEKITIGDHVLISHNVNIMDTNSHEISHLERSEGYYNLITEGFPQKKGNILTSEVKIDDYVWINFNVIILKGITIGKGAIIAAGSIITKNVEPFTLVGGNPAVVIKKLI